MSSPDEHECAWPEHTYPCHGHDDGILYDLPHLALGPYSSQDLAPQDLAPQYLPPYYPALDAWGCEQDFQFDDFWSQPSYFTPTPVSEGFTFPAPQSHDAPVVDACTQFTYPFAPSIAPLSTLSSQFQSRSPNRPSTDVERGEHSPKAPLHDAQAAAASDVVLREKGPTVKGRCALDEMRVIGKPRRNNKTGALEGTQIVFGNKKGAVRKLDLVGRLNAARTRKFGACRLCRESKKQCNLAFVNYDYQVCKSCANSPLYTKAHIFRMPCFKSPISAAVFFRLKPSAESPHRSTRRDEVYQNRELPGHLGPARKIQLTQGIRGHTLTLWVSKFTPSEGDKIAYTWVDARGPHSVSMPPFCITNVEDAKESIKRYVRDSRYDYIGEKLEAAPLITRLTFAMAIKFSQSQDSLVQLALDLWSASRIIEDSWYICGSDTLGVKPVHDPANHFWHEKVPVTPIMDTQLDQFVIQEVLMPRKDALLTRLQRLIENFKPEAWFELFITIFVLLSTIEAAGAHQWRFARRYGFTSRFANHKEMGALPIQSINWKDHKSVRFAQLNEEQVRFMEYLQGLVSQEGEQLRNLRPKNKYDQFLYWCHQLFFGEWKPGEKEIEDEIP